MTSKLTSEQLIKKAQEQIAFCRDTKITGEGRAHVDQCAALFEIALAALDSEPVAWRVSFTQIGHESNNFTKTYWDEEEKDRWVKLHELCGFKVDIEPLYRHAQQPVVPPMQHWEELCREHPDMSIGDAIIRAAWWNHCRAAMLQAGYAVRDLSTPVDPQVAEYEQNVMQAGNSSVIGIDPASGPDRTVEVRYVSPPGYVMVPKEPTESMIINGFESEPDETFSESEVWEAYQKMSGCEQAAYRARLCWDAMLAAAPQEV